MLFPILLTAQRPSELLPHPDWEIIVWIVGTAVLLVVSTTIYIVSAIRNRGKPKPDRLGNGNFLGVSPGGGRGPAAGGPAGGAYVVVQHRLFGACPADRYDHLCLHSAVARIRLQTTC